MSRQPGKGKASPRWALWSRYEIPCRDGLLYLARLRVVQTPWFGLLLHNIHEPDEGADPHNHPWSFVSVILRGHYVERVYADPANARSMYIEKRHGRGSVHLMGRGAAHQIVEASPGLRTLILTGPRRSGWGFFEPDGSYVAWQDYLRVGVRA